MAEQPVVSKVENRDKCQKKSQRIEENINAKLFTVIKAEKQIKVEKNSLFEVKSKQVQEEQPLLTTICKEDVGAFQYEGEVSNKHLKSLSSLSSIQIKKS